MGIEKPLVTNLRIDILVENSTFKKNFYAEHGLSILINAETEDDKKYLLLFDTGASGKPLINNLNIISKDITNLDGIILSHGHYDHTGGLIEVFKLLDKKIPIFLHPDALNSKYSKENGNFRSIGIPLKRSELAEFADIKISKSPQFIHPSIFTTGQIERVTSFEKVPPKFHQKINDSLIHDDILDDQSLIIQLRKGIVILSGCGHSGMINIIKKAIKMTKTKRINLLIGGFHLLQASEKEIDSTLNGLRQFKIDLISPIHCTGLYATARLVNEYLERIRNLHTGDNIILAEDSQKL